VISSSIESSLGLTQLARIAAWLTPDTIPGLDTLNLMQAQLIRRGRTARCRASTLRRWSRCCEFYRLAVAALARAVC
jgi:O-succinylbenzoate synthase